MGIKETSSGEWELLPYHILEQVMSYLPLTSRYHASLTCKSWKACFDSPMFWKKFNFNFIVPTDARLISCVTNYGHLLRDVSIHIEQKVSANQENVCRFLRELVKFSCPWKIRIEFARQNPYRYEGTDIIGELSEVFKKVPSSDHEVDQPLYDSESDAASNLSSVNAHIRRMPVVGQLRDVDLSGFSVCIKDPLISLLATYHPLLEKLNVQNNFLQVELSPSCVLNLVQNCRKLRDMRLYMRSIDSAVLECFAEEKRAPLQHLSLIVRREQYIVDLPESIWNKLVAALPNLRVSLIFNHTCKPSCLRATMKPQIPVKMLQLETFISTHEAVIQAAHCFSDTLETLVLQHVLSKNTPELNTALVLVAEKCIKLTSLHVLCWINIDTVVRIRELRPALRESNACTFRYAGMFLD